MSKSYRETSTNFYLFFEQFKRALQALLNEQVIIKNTI